MSNESDDTTQKEELIITPSGPLPRNRVHSVEPGEAISIDESGIARVIPCEQEGGTVNIAQDMVVTPGGYRPKSLVHLIEPGYILDGTGGHLRKLDPSGQIVVDFGPIPARPGNAPLMPGNAVGLQEVSLQEKVPAFGDGWIAFALCINTTSTPISSFTTTWIVPRAPATQSDQLIFLFNGIQNSTMIYQPVLQWGNNGKFGGNHWEVASWFADGQGGPAFHSQPTQVNVGDVLIGVMTLTGPGGLKGTFNYNCQFQGIVNSGLPIQNVQQLTQCVETLEAYRITKCSDYPATDGMVFWQINIQTGGTTPTLNWGRVNKVTGCDQHAVVLRNSNSEGEVVIYNRQAGSLSLRNLLVTQGADPSQGVRKFIQVYHPSISSLRALLEL